MQKKSVQIRHTPGDAPLTRFVSGRTVYDEAFLNGMPIARYWSDSGQIWPDMHLLPENLSREARAFPMGTFSLSVNGGELFDFSLVETGETKDTTGLRSEGEVKVYYQKLRHSGGVEVKVLTRIDGSPFLVRWLEITNRSGVPIGIDFVCPMAGRVWAHYRQHYRDPLTVAEATGDETGNPFSYAYNHLTRWGTEGDFYFENLPSGETRFDGGRNGKSGWSRPAFWLRNRYSGKTFVCELAYSGNWEFRLNYSSAGDVEQVGFAIGIPETPGEYCRVLGVEETAVTPAVHAGTFSCSDDEIVQALHSHVRNTVMPAPPTGREVEIEANHRGYLCDLESDEGIRKDVDVAASIGAEMYVIDAGWYGEPPNRWWNNVGDWYAGEWLPQGMRSIADYVHDRGMLFGLWIEIEAAGSNSRLRAQHPDWSMTRGGEPFIIDGGRSTGRALDLTRPDVVQWIEEDVIGYAIREYALDMYRIDHNHSMGDGGNRQYHGMTENLLWRYYDNLYGMFDRLLKKYPDVVFQNCAGGGGRMDFGIFQRFHNAEMSDWMRPPREVKIYGGLTMALPPERLLRTFGTEVPGLDMDPDLDFQLRIATVCRPIFRGISPSQDELNDHLKDRIDEKLDLYRGFLRPVLKNCRMFHHTPMTPVLKPAAWNVFEYIAEDGQRAFAALFRLNMDSCEGFLLRPRSLDRGKLYRVRFDNSKDTFEATGQELINDGLFVDSYGSEVITFEVL